MLCRNNLTKLKCDVAWLENIIEFDTPPQPREYTFTFSTGTGLYLLDVINSLSRSLHLLRLINGKNISSSFALGVCVNMSAKFLCSRYLLQSHTSRSNQVLQPRDSRIYVLHASNTSSVKECMCCTAVHFDLNFVVSQTNKHQYFLQQQCLLDSF